MYNVGMAIKERTPTNFIDRFFTAFEDWVGSHGPKWLHDTIMFNKGGLFTPKLGQDSRWLGVPLIIVSSVALIVLFLDLSSDIMFDY